MPHFRLSAKARADLKGIARYTERNWGKAQRNQYLLQIDQCFHLLADNPELGKTSDEIRSGYRYYPQGSHVIFYRIAGTSAIEIIRVLHKRMLPEIHFP